MQRQYRERVSLKNPVHFCALGFGSGLVPVMPGTFGSLAAIPLLLMTWSAPLWMYVSITLLVAVAGIYFCGQTAKDMQVHDHGSIVWDEVAGMFCTFLLIPLTPAHLVAGLVLFRFFDILKPWPIYIIDKRWHGGTGIMLDDVVAGLMACVSLHAILLLWPF
ncbi:phosphatidylglycerophosphatase A [Salinimonas marina]|uniref:Phosphatidylglycerophosphatase A n=1 Tax=Salinimonas marina TaxID=2785918 RepID=A0A7S9DZ35_9ALTE|nr:phosphatidylglycerophosphatase A [Salinimonas marina]QPG06594.1 phosphatidylglycerophosphatase A [Salinimonas marina]